MSFMITLIAIAVPGLAHAGRGSVADHGSCGLIHLNVAIDDDWDSHFGNNADYYFHRLQEHFDAASRRLWNATEGHLRIGDVTFYHENNTTADIYVKTQNCIGAEVDPYGEIGGDGEIRFCYEDLRIATSSGSSDGFVIVHELGHYVLGLGDEYTIDQKLDEFCDGPALYGTCIAHGSHDGRSNCIMESRGPIDSEFCAEKNHDLDRENACVETGDANVPYPAPITHQSVRNAGESCWETMSRKYSFIPSIESISADGLPSSSEPVGYVAPSFVDLRGDPESIVLVLDRSGSMGLHPDGDFVEVCSNQRDDDRDGTVDESDCGPPRIELLQAEADEEIRAQWYANLPALKVALTSFSGVASTDVTLQPLLGKSADYDAAIAALTPSGGTAIGDAISIAYSEIASEQGTKAIVLLSDGQQNTGSDPVAAAASVASQGVAIHTISMGEASDTPTLTEIANQNAAQNSSLRNSRSLMASFLTLWTQMSNHVLLVPEQRYHTNSPWMNPDGTKPPFEVPAEHEFPDDAWFTGIDKLADIPSGAEINRLPFLVADGTDFFTVVLGGSVKDMSLFCVDASLKAPGGSIHTLGSPGPEGQWISDTHFEMLRLNRPEPGQWFLEISTRCGPLAEQKGTVTVFAGNRAARQSMAVSVAPRIASVKDEIEVHILPRYVSNLRDLDELALQMIDPTGAVQSVPIQVMENGGYSAKISGLAFRGVHTMWVKARSGPGTHHMPGETFGGVINSVPVSPLLMGQTASFFVTDGKDVSPPRKDESEIE